VLLCVCVPLQGMLLSEVQTSVFNAVGDGPGVLVVAAALTPFGPQLPGVSEPENIVTDLLCSRVLQANDVLLVIAENALVVRSARSAF